MKHSESPPEHIYKNMQKRDQILKHEYLSNLCFDDGGIFLCLPTPRACLSSKGQTMYKFMTHNQTYKYQL